MRFFFKTLEDEVKKAAKVEGADGTYDEMLASLVFAQFTKGTRTSKAVAAQYLAGRLKARQARGDLTAEKLRDIERAMHCYGFGKGGRAWIINEAHGLRAQTVRALKTLLEPIPDHVAFCFTTTRAEEGLLFDGAEDARPLVGRCTPVPLTTQGLAKPAAQWLRTIAQAEGLDGKPEAAYVRLFNESAGSFREALQRIDAGAMMEGTT